MRPPDAFPVHFRFSITQRGTGSDVTPHTCIVIQIVCKEHGDCRDNVPGEDGEMEFPFNLGGKDAIGHAVIDFVEVVDAETAGVHGNRITSQHEDEAIRGTGGLIPDIEQ